MRCLNSPPTLNPLETCILDSLPPHVRHVAIVGAGDGRLGRAVRERLGADSVKVSVVEPRAALLPYLDDFSEVGENPWALDWYAARTQADGPFDAIIFYQIHEYWRGNLLTFKQILNHLASDGSCWISYLNTAALDTLARRLPPSATTAAASMGDPSRLVPQLDLAAWLNFLQPLGCAPDQLWALLEERAYKFLQNPGTPVTWELGELKMPIQTTADALLWGGRFHAIQFHRVKPGEAPKEARVTGTLLNGPLYQALLLPYPDAVHMEADLLVAQMEVDAWRNRPAGSEIDPGPWINFLLSQIESLPEVRDVLVIGNSWGRDLLALQTARPNWKITGLETGAVKTESAAAALEESSISTHRFVPGESLPFEEGAFDLALSLGYFSNAYPPVATALLPELDRVSRLGVVQIEDSRGPDLNLQLKPLALQDAQSRLGRQPVVAAIEVNGTPNGLVLVKWLKNQ
jgi:hypothetical protein